VNLDPLIDGPDRRSEGPAGVQWVPLSSAASSRNGGGRRLAFCSFGEVLHSWLHRVLPGVLQAVDVTIQAMCKRNSHITAAFHKHCIEATGRLAVSLLQATPHLIAWLQGVHPGLAAIAPFPRTATHLRCTPTAHTICTSVSYSGRALVGRHLMSRPLEKRWCLGRSVAGHYFFMFAVVCQFLLQECAGDDSPFAFTPDAIPTSSIPNSYDSAAACSVAYFHIHISDACTNVSLSASSNTTQHLSVLVCTRRAQLATSGSVIFLDTSQPRRNTTRVYRARLVGPEALVLPMTYCSKHMAVATYSVATAGQYTLELLQLFTSFTFDDVTPMLRDFYLAEVPIVVPKARTTARVAPCCSLCRKADVPGRWLLSPTVAPLLSKTCPPTAGAPQCHSRSAVIADPSMLNERMMRWQPYGCSLLPSSDHEACRARLQHVCFFGDSQTRHIFDTFVHPAFNTNLSAWYGGLGPESDSDFSLPSYTFIPMLWGNELGAHDLRNCSTIVANFGQWPLSAASGKTVNGTDISWPWSPSQFLRQVDALANQLQAAVRAGKRAWWTTIGTHPYVDQFVDGMDFRSDPYLLLFNNIASTVMQQYGIPIIDTYSITDTFKDLAYDSAHYKGNVGHWAAAAVAHAICSEPGVAHNDTHNGCGDQGVSCDGQHAQAQRVSGAARAVGGPRVGLPLACAGVVLLAMYLLAW
jgi:hypothetical protein